MLTYFPTPYPEELWYSVLCRYHIQSGNNRYGTTTRELFGNSRKTVNLWTGGSSLCELLQELPPNLFSAEELYLHHTLNPYLLRFTKAIRKQEAKRYIIEGEDIRTLSSILKPWLPENPKLRYCPLCVQEDMQKYGETYWHCSHQIQAMPLCHKHLCVLENSDIEVNMTKERFISASMHNCMITEPRYTHSEHDKRLTQYLYDFWNEPLQENADPVWVTQSLQAQLQNIGYFLKSSTRVQRNELLPDLIEFWGEDKVHTFLGDKWFWNNIYDISSTGNYFQPEGYALLGIFLNLSSSVFTDPAAQVHSDIEKKLREMSVSGMKWAKKRVAEELGVASYQLDGIVAQYGITPFWNTTSKGKSEKPKRIQYVIKAFVTEEERKFYVKRAKNIGASSVSAYLKYCMEKEVEDSKNI